MLKGSHHSEEAKRKNSEAHKGAKNPNYGKNFSEEHKMKISLALKGKPKPEKHKRKIIERNIHVWGGQHHSEEAKRKIAKGLRGEKHYLFGKQLPEETKRKIRNTILNLENFRGNKGDLRHQNLVKKVATQYNDGINKVEIEKSIKLGRRHWRIIDVFVNNKLCIEIGTCAKNKIEELTNNGYTVIHLPYSCFN